MKKTTDLTEIKLMLLYTIAQLKEQAQLTCVTDMIMENTIVNYFTLLQYLTELTETGYVAKNADIYYNTQKGSEALGFFEKSIPYTTRENLKASIRKLLNLPSSDILTAFSQREDGQYEVSCSVQEGNSTLFELKLPVGTVKTAERACAAFEATHGELYQFMLEKLCSGPRFEAVLFDLDGTLLDSISDLAYSMNEILARRGYPGHTPDDYKHMIGWGMRELIAHALPEAAQDEETINAVQQEMKTAYRQNSKRSSYPFAGVIPLLAALSKNGMRLGILSNKVDEFAKEMAAYYLSDFSFDVVLGQRAGVPIKPNPAAALEAAEIMKVAPQRVIYVGDSDVDMQLAQNAGMYGVGAVWGYRGREELAQNGAQFLADTPEDILTLI